MQVASPHLSRMAQAVIAVVVPCFRVRAQLADVISGIGPEVAHIIIVDDACPEGSGSVGASVDDPRIILLRHSHNLGVGGAVKTGYAEALRRGADIIVKLDGDGQMAPANILSLVGPILSGDADYTKGNRFHSIYFVRQMPRVRLIGNAVLSFMTKISSGYWTIFDPTNGFTAIHKRALAKLELANIADRYFFESDMLINLGVLRAVVCDVPMEAVYASEKSNLSIRRLLWPFLISHLRAITKRVLYTYFLRDFSLASIQLVLGALLIAQGLGWGVMGWLHSISSGQPATTGTVMLAVLPILLGFQLLMAHLAFDFANEPRRPLQSEADWRFSSTTNQFGRRKTDHD